MITDKPTPTRVSYNNVNTQLMHLVIVKGSSPALCPKHLPSQTPAIYSYHATFSFHFINPPLGKERLLLEKERKGGKIDGEVKFVFLFLSDEEEREERRGKSVRMGVFSVDWERS